MKFPGALKFGARSILHAWARTGKANGYLYHVVSEYGHLLSGGEHVTELAWGSRMRLRLDDVVEQKIYFFRVYEPAETHFVKALLRPGDTVINAGANVGYYTLLAAASVGKSGKVHAFEPVPSNFARLTANVELSNVSKQVRLNPCALWSENTELVLNLSEEDALNQGAFSVGATKAAATSVVTPALRLDDYVADAGIESLRLIKMDIEGAEYPALQGAAKTLERFHPTILLEVNPSAMEAAGSRVSQLHEFMRQFGYRSFRPGTSAGESGYIQSWEGLPQGNLLLSVEDLPTDITSRWSLRELLHSFRTTRHRVAHV